jgi:chaperonin GroEL (HSP60 family)
MQLRRGASEFSAKHQLAILGFADALESMAEILVGSAGLNPLTVIPELRAAHVEGGVYTGIDVKGRKIADMRELGIFHPLTVAEQTLNSAVEAAILILRIGDMVLSNSCKHKDKAHDPDHNRKLHKDYKLESLEAGPEPTAKRN